MISPPVSEGGPDQVRVNSCVNYFMGAVRIKILFGLRLQPSHWHPYPKEPGMFGLRVHLNPWHPCTQRV